LELWLLLALVIAALATGTVTRLRRSRRAADKKETGNIYPLW
jgi:hypothetical protein